MAKPKPTKVVRLEVTQEIIDRAVKRDSTACVLADALKIAVPGGTRPLVDLQVMSISVPEKGLRYHWLTPRIAQALLINFDQGTALSPTSLALREGWTTPIDKHHRRTGKSRVSREERKKELERHEAAGTLTGAQANHLRTMRETDERDACKAGIPDRKHRPPAASLSNANGRRYGLRLTRLTQHGEALVEGLHSE